MRPRLTIEEVRIFCAIREIECLDTVYKNNHTKMTFKCKKNGHTWKTTYAVIKKGSGCPYHPCKKRGLLSLEYVKEQYKKKGIECLATIYVDDHTHMPLRCEHGHTWEASYTGLRAGRGCPYFPCDKKGTLHPEYILNICNSRGILCNLEEYKTCKSKILFTCKNCGCTWRTTLDSIKNNCTGCPDCNNRRYVKERACVTVMEELTGLPFKDFSPSWLRHKEQLRFDGYNDCLKVAVEYNGEYHYKKVKKFKMTEEDLKEVQERDTTKARLCKEHGVRLLVVPYTVPPKKFKEYLKNLLFQGNTS